MQQIKPIIIDYGSGNLRSVAKAFSHVLGLPVQVSSHAADLAKATHIILPGVGAFGDCAAGLRALPSMVDALEEQVLGNKKPFLGICVGMQLLADIGHEHGKHRGLGWIGGEVVALEPRPQMPVPHMGWNNLQILQPHQLLEKISGDVYFVHSFRYDCASEHVLATSPYCTAIQAVVAKGNIFGVQFHPEKSQQAGLQLIENFLNFS